LPSGGARRVTIEQCRGLRGRGHAIEAFVLETADEAFLPTAAVVDRLHLWPVGNVPSQERLHQPATALALIGWARLVRRLPRVHGAIAAAVDAGGFDVVLATHDQFTQAPHVLRCLTTPSVYYCHEPLRIVHDQRVDPAARMLRRIRRAVAAPLVRLLGSIDSRAALAAGRVIVNSEYTAESVQRAYGIKARVVHPGVHAAQFEPLGLAREHFVLSVGTLHPAKGHDFVAEALARLPAERRPGLVVVADRELGEFRGKLEAVAARGGVALRIAMRVSEAELVAFYNRATAVVCAAHLEPFGLVPLEAMACGTPIIAVAEGGLRETVRDGVTGRLVPRDVDALALAIDELALDPGAVRDRAATALAEVRERWTWEVSCERLERELFEVARS
jgi:glycosyltransferase involved in cell wall biosynthesis